MHNGEHNGEVYRPQRWGPLVGRSIPWMVSPFIYIPSRARGRVSHDPFWGIIETLTGSREGPIMGHIMGPIMVLFMVPLMETYDVP